MCIRDSYQSVLKDNLLSNYQYILQIPAEAMDEDKKLESLVQMMYVQSCLLYTSPPLVRILFMGLSPEWGDWIYRALTFLVISRCV